MIMIFAKFIKSLEPLSVAELSAIKYSLNDAITELIYKKRKQMHEGQTRH
jgi:hypothetical protein